MYSKKINFILAFICLSVFAENPQKPFVPKVIQSPRDVLAKKEYKKRAVSAESFQNPWSIGIKAPFNFIFGVTSTGSSFGVDYGGGVELRIPLAPEWRISIHPLFYRLAISRKVDGTGSIIDNGPTFTQFINYVAGELLLAYQFSQELSHEKEFLTEEWWFEVGGMFGYPLSAIQTDTLGDTVTFTPTDKLLYAVIGVNTKMNLSDTMSLWPTLRAFYRFLGTGGSAIFGGGIQVALHWQL